MVLADDDTASFLQALARRMSTRLIVFVPARRQPRAMWISARGGDDEVDDLAGIGRDWLATYEQQRVVAQPDDGVTRVSDDTITLAPTSTGSAAAGALVARKEVGSPWTPAERALIRFAADYYAPLLERCASRPRPDRSILLQDGERSPLARSLENGIHSAAANGELFLRYQPEIDLRDGSVVAVEALVRWNHPLRGELGPESFIAVAERSDLIKVLGGWVVDESLREFAQLSAVRPGMSLRVNVSPVQIGGELVAQFADALVEHGVAGEQVCVEITENVLSRDTPLLASTLQALKRLGICSAIDDLASGYSSLTRLRSFPVDVVKIDRGLVSGIDGDERAQAIVAALITLADVLGIQVVAEGVETPNEASALLRLGCLRAQGHFFGRPMTAAQMTDFLRAG